MKAFKFSLVLRTRENTDVFITLDDNIYGIHSQRVNILYILLKTIDCGYSLELPLRGSSNEYPHSIFWEEIRKISEFFIWNFSIFGCKHFNIFE